ncbi:Protein EXORDIUM [Camellia lanceoleosa]|uniref:Protein EXORDIUM n=1 Tax=Camellia lanceoleosa TaxID=1840588 RepID=A0ACC0FUN2_9ERIC|nr:Protein EXORDIUM [Camellia lanceoleosa]
MASLVSSRFILQLLFVVSLFHISFAARKLSELVQDQTNLLQYHYGPLLSSKISINLIWYSKFNPTQRAIISDFVISMFSSPLQTQPSVVTWWKTTQNNCYLVNF